MRKSLALGLLLAVLGGAPAPGTAQPAAPSPKPHLSTERAPTGLETLGFKASLQGGLVDVRYGQVSIDNGGTSTVLEISKDSVLTLDGKAITAEELVKHIPQGLSVAVVYNWHWGLAGSVDAFSNTSAMPKLSIRILPWKGPAYGSGELVTVVVPAHEVRRLGGDMKATVPGIARDLAFMPAQGGARKVMFRVSRGMDFADLPVFVISGDVVYRAGRLNISTTPPEVTDYGPQQASSKLATIPGWVDLRTRTPLLDPTTARLTVSPGARVVSFQPRVDRSVFEIEADGPGEYWLDFSVQDKMGRTVRQRWPLRVLP